MSWWQRLTGQEERTRLRRRLEALEEERSVWHRAALMDLGPDGAAFIHRQLREDQLSDLATEDVGWIGASGTQLELDQGRLSALQHQCRYLYHRDPHARAIVELYTHLICGSGVQLGWGDDETAADAWREWAAASEWERRHRDVARTLILQGEHLSLVMPIATEPPLEPGTLVPWRPSRRSSTTTRPQAVALRQLEPTSLEKIITDPDDWETRLGYVTRDASGGRREWSARGVYHLRIGAPGSTQRGRPLLEPVVRQLTQYRMWLADRAIVNAVAARVPLMRGVKGSPAEVDAAAARITKMPAPGSVLTHNEGETWSFPAHNPQANQAEADGRALRLAIAAGVGLPEYMVTADGSNGSYASTLSQESPAHRAIESYRDLMTGWVEWVAGWVTGRRPETIEWPALEARDRLKEAQAHQILVMQRLESRETARARLGLDAQEREKIETELADDLELGGRFAPEEPEE